MEKSEIYAKKAEEALENMKKPFASPNYRTYAIVYSNLALAAAMKESSEKKK